MQTQIIETSEITQAELASLRELEKEKKDHIERMKAQAWGADIDPEAYFTGHIEEIAEERIEYQERKGAIERVAEEIRNLKHAEQVAAKWINNKIESEHISYREEAALRYLRSNLEADIK